MDVALIGSSGHTGYVTNEMDHPAVDIVGVAPGSAGEDVSDLYGQVSDRDASVALYESAGELLEEEQPDVSAISCQFADLAPVSEQALEMGVDVFTEKPLATTLTDLERLRDAYEESDAELVGMFGIRYDPWFYTAHRRIEEGAIGDVRLLYGQKSYRLGSRPEFYRSRETYGGTIPWVGIHAIDWINWVTDAEFESVHAQHSRRQNRDHGDLETSGVVTLELSDEVLATVSVDYYRPDTAPTHGDDQLRVVGTDGVIVVRDEELYLINDGHEGERRLQQQDGGSIFPDFLSMLAGESDCLITAEESFRATEVSLKARDAADKRRTLEL